MLLTRQGSRGGQFIPARPQVWFGDPLHMTATSQVPPGSAGSVNALAFRPPTQSAGMVLSAIKFQIQPAVLGSLVNAFAAGAFQYGKGFQLGHAISVSFALAKYNGDVSGGLDPTSGNVAALGAFSNRVPIGTLCDSRDVSSDLLSGGYKLAGDASFLNANPISEYRWDLPEPFYIPPGYIFLPQFYGFGGNVTGNVGVLNGAASLIPALAVQVSYEGTILDSTRYGADSIYDDDVTRVPFAASFIAPQTPVGAAPLPYLVRSDETQLTNIFDNPAVISRINGKILAVPEFSDTVVDVGNSFAVRMISANSMPLVRDLIPWRVVFDRQSRSWGVLPAGGAPYQLDPGESIIATISAIGGAVVTAGNLQPIIALTGYRELPLSSL